MTTGNEGFNGSESKIDPERVARDEQIAREWRALITPEKTDEAVSAQLADLRRAYDAGEINTQGWFPIEKLKEIQRAGRPLTQEDVGNYALVLHEHDFDEIGHLEFMAPWGDSMVIDKEDFRASGYGPGRPLIMKPDEFGSAEA